MSFKNIVCLCVCWKIHILKTFLSLISSISVKKTPPLGTGRLYELPLFATKHQSVCSARESPWKSPSSSATECRQPASRTSFAPGWWWPFTRVPLALTCDHFLIRLLRVFQTASWGRAPIPRRAAPSVSGLRAFRCMSTRGGKGFNVLYYPHHHFSSAERQAQIFKWLFFFSFGTPRQFLLFTE